MSQWSDGSVVEQEGYYPVLMETLDKRPFMVPLSSNSYILILDYLKKKNEKSEILSELEKLIQ